MTGNDGVGRMRMARSQRSILARAALLTGLWMTSAPLLWCPALSCQEPGDRVTVSAVAGKSPAHPGDQVPIAVILAHGPGLHTWPNKPVVPPPLQDLMPIATRVSVVRAPDGAQVGEIQWPEPTSVTVRYTGEDVALLAYVDSTVVYVPLTLAAEQAPGDALVELRVRYQACDSVVCYPPETVALSVPIVVTAATEVRTIDTTQAATFETFDLDAYRPQRTSYTPPAYLNVFGWSFSFDPLGVWGVALLLALAALGGLLLNVTPCVLPLVPVKIIGLQRAAGDPRRLKFLGGAMGLGVVAFWLVLGGAIAWVSGFDAISSLFQTGWFAPLVGIIAAVAGLSMLASFDLRLPRVVYLIDPREDSLPGSFLFGTMTAVLSTPCTAPFMAGAAAWAVLQRPPIVLATFGSIGAGMAVPYVLLSMRPSLLSRVPHSGPSGVLVRQVMGLLILAVAAFFLGSGAFSAPRHPGDLPNRAYWWVVGAFVVAACAWGAFRGARLAKTTLWKFLVPAVGLAAALLTVATVSGLSGHGPIDWVGYTPDRFSESRAQGQVIVLDFTAEWCLNCKALEAGVLNQEGVATVLSGPDVAPMRVDLTADNPVGQAKLRELRWLGIPLLAIYGPGTGYESPILYDSYTAGMVQQAVATARAPATQR